jgi:UDP-2-acetamido-2,6-beta-L-arabino-hexul-4-ose reductase
VKVLITGAAGFIGRNLSVRLAETGVEVVPFTRDQPESGLDEAIRPVDAVVHLAGVNRPPTPGEFESINVGLTRRLCDALRASDRPLPVLFASSAQALDDNPYGRSKLSGERELVGAAAATGGALAIYRLPGVFGKWCRPNYNSVVATFCHNIARGLPIEVSDPARIIQLVYIDEVVDAFIAWLRDPGAGVQLREIPRRHEVSLGDLAGQIEGFNRGRDTLNVGRVGIGFTRALYATFVSYLPPGRFAYDLPVHGDVRGAFVEMLKTPDSGQFSYFTARPGVTRGGHYHHTKTEKFLVLKGRARFGFRNLVTGEACSLDTSGEQPRVVDTIPGWVHDITNIGEDELIVMLWANEVFDRQRPDTIAGKV